MIFQTRENKEKTLCSILGEGTNDEERAMYWILSEFWIHCLDCCSILDTVWLLQCRVHQLPAPHRKSRQPDGRKRSDRPGIRVPQYARHIHPHADLHFRIQEREGGPYPPQPAVSSISQCRPPLACAAVHHPRLFPMLFPQSSRACFTQPMTP